MRPGAPLLAAAALLAAACGGRGGGDPDGGADGPPGDPDGGDPVSCLRPANADPSGTAQLVEPLGTATVAIDDRGACRRTYTLATTQPLRHGLPANPRTVPEAAGAPTLRSGHDLLDALYALALEEVRECSVDAIRDGAFNGGQPVGCGDGGCFETGRLWNYVWTRDTAYAVHLGLAALDPVRARNSLEFKLSERRGGGDLQIVQDTGSGGSYPISSDRVAWALGAWELHAQLDGAARAQFRARALEAIRNTLEHDRAVVFDPADGLYRGEQSFLDWRQQSYPEWTAEDTVHLGMSKALSTNLLHLKAMEVAAAFADAEGDAAARDRYAAWAADLRQAIRDRLWLPEEGLFSTYVTTTLDPAPARRHDLLGSALAVILGVADAAQASSILSRYPHYGPGAPVIWPQQQQTPIYHNRGEWPFVTAYWLRAAKLADHDGVADRMVRALVRGAALNLSHMENLEAASGAPWVDDGEFSGPVVNSQRQLWSVAAFVSMVHHTLFGLEASPGGLSVRPYVTRGLRNGMLAGTDQLVLNDVPWRGRRLSVVIHLPPTGGAGGGYPVGEIRVGGVPVTADPIPPSALPDGARIDVHLLATGDRAPAAVEVRPDADWRRIFAPRTPRITSVGEAGGKVRLSLSTNGEDPATVTLSIYRDGARIASGLPGTTSSWDDPGSDANAAASPCYAVEACFPASGNCSQRSPPVCWWGAGYAAIQELGADGFTATGGTPVTEYGRFHYQDWGDPGHELLSPPFTAARTGLHLVQLLYGNGAGSVETGITCAVKRVVVIAADTEDPVGDGIALMPHLGTWDRWGDSSFVPVELEAGRSYRVIVRGDDRAVNMSVFEHFATYGGAGGAGGPFQRVNVAAIKILAR